MKLLATKIQKLDVPNSNGRTYTTTEMSKTLAKVEHGLLGRVGYPSGPDAGIVLTETSHMVENLRLEDGWLVGDITVLATEQGKILQDAIEADKDALAFRMLGIGNVDKDGIVRNFEVTGVCAISAGSAA